MTDSSALGRRERNKRRTRDALLTAARTLFAARGVAGTTVEDIADLADVSRATFFNYFPSKDGLLAALHTIHMDSLARVVDRLLEQDLTTGDRIVGLFDDFVQATGNVPGYLQAVTGELERDLASPQISAERTDRFDQEILRLLTPGIESGEVRTDYPPQFLARMVAAVYVSTIRYWRQDPAYDLAEGFRMAGSYVAESLATRA
ncbi:TetR/AcrR family transcriptional regulator [Prescottella equi]|uniref:TetR/AcrR family transcriptional regulator n=1 Tax=Rhodococcus hoagii TaxID=43767 RepID=UPI0007CD6715|nr:TetR/AcrR family transcriptional regulator [Prescottella equi]NKR82229.1 TetR family transcriptional regulator [Prescottella equi]ORJ94465.1 TetR family transcriptional regulator [Prescottella equi]ORL09329.1 TetR family transcriptional regulator [Prescottella equi]ORL72570.1 TetR family transcriptional regulator [Prescottella equi]ORL87498.1 TetR family transcriptional regulator [Prescottella equi]